MRFVRDFFELLRFFLRFGDARERGFLVGNASRRRRVKDENEPLLWGSAAVNCAENIMRMLGDFKIFFEILRFFLRFGDARGGCARDHY